MKLSHNHYGDFTMGQMLDERMIQDLAPVAPLLDRLIESANTETTPKLVAQAFPGLRRPSHLRRVGGMARWAEVADGLVAADHAGELPAGYSLGTDEADHNRGQYAFRYPGGVFTLRRSPHDDEQHEGVFLQQQFQEIVDLLDEQGAPDADDAVRVWIKIRPEGNTTFTARDRYGHETTVTLHEILAAASTPPAIHPVTDVLPRTLVRSNRQQDTGSASS
jgi:hypothetical protein